LSGALPKLPNFRKLLLTNPNKSLKRDVLALIASARETLDVTVWALDSDNEVFSKLMVAAKRVRVRLLAHEESANRLALAELAQAGAEIRFCPGMHAKVWLADRESNPSAVVSSANLLPDGLDVGFELGVRLEPGDARLHDISSFVASREAHARPWAPSHVAAEKNAHSLKQIDKVVRIAPRLKLF
jgi:hypothetical protein